MQRTAISRRNVDAISEKTGGPYGDLSLPFTIQFQADAFRDISAYNTDKTTVVYTASYEWD